MKFLIDESTGPSVCHWLRSEGFAALFVASEMQGAPDLDILAKAANENWVIVTNDKDFGDLIFRDKHKHCGVILLRLDDETPSNKISVLSQVLQSFPNEIESSFIVATERGIRRSNIPF